jgi:hypothetical protein
MPRQHLRERALPGPVRPHDGVHLTRLDLEIDAAEDRGAVDRGMEILDY